MKQSIKISLLAYLSIIFANAYASTSTQALKYESTIYRDKQYNFQIMVPDTSTISREFPGNYFFDSNEWRIHGGKNGKPIIRIPYFIWQSNYVKPTGHYYNNEIRIGISSNKNDIDNCIKNAASTKIINGITFYVFEDADTGMNKTAKWTSYRTVHNKQCFAIEQILYYSNSLIAQQLNNAGFNETTQAIAESFSFNNS